MATLLDPAFTVAFDEAAGRIVATFRDGRDAQVIEFDPEKVPALVNALMASKAEAKAAAKRTAPPPAPPKSKFVQHPAWTRTGRGRSKF